MTNLTDLPRKAAPAPLVRNLRPHPLRLALVALLAALAFLPGAPGALTRGLMHDAYVGVSVFVAATLFLVYGGERLLGLDLGEILRRNRHAQVPVAALLGMTPGCAGAIVVTAAYSAGNVSLGALVAALTGTMGDAAFLLLATRPDAAAAVLSISLVAGIVTGLIVDRFHKTRYNGRAGTACEIAPRIGRVRLRDILFAALAVPGLGLGLMDAFRIDPGTFGSMAGQVIALAGMAVLAWIWAFSPVPAITNPADPPLPRAAEETAFITIWVLAAYLAFGYVEAFAGFDLAALFKGLGPLLPLLGVLIGFIPGCGPQILVATLYINGLIPFSALIANAISNDGDALFPAIALNPKAAVIATLYTAIPAIVVGYAFHFLAPGFMN